MQFDVCFLVQGHVYLYKGMPLVLTSWNHRLSPKNTNPDADTPLYIVTDNVKSVNADGSLGLTDDVQDFRSDLHYEEGAVNFRPFPENRYRGSHPSWLSFLNTLKEDGSGWMSGGDSSSIVTAGDGDILPRSMGIADQVFHNPPPLNSVSQGILGVSLQKNGRYLVEFIVPASTPETAVTFILNNIENRVAGLFAQEEVSGIVSADGQPLVQDGTVLTRKYLAEQS